MRWLRFIINPFHADTYNRKTFSFLLVINFLVVEPEHSTLLTSKLTNEHFPETVPSSSQHHNLCPIFRAFQGIVLCNANLISAVLSRPTYSSRYSLLDFTKWSVYPLGNNCNSDGECIIDHKIVTVLGTPCATPPRNRNIIHSLIHPKPYLLLRFAYKHSARKIFCLEFYPEGNFVTGDLKFKPILSLLILYFSCIRFM
jgi:hypothetical protein